MDEVFAAVFLCSLKKKKIRETPIDANDLRVGYDVMNILRLYFVHMYFSIRYYLCCMYYRLYALRTDLYPAMILSIDAYFCDK